MQKQINVSQIRVTHLKMLTVHTVSWVQELPVHTPPLQLL